MKTHQVFIATGHPHSGCSGYFEETEDGNYADAIRPLGNGPLMVRVNLEQCEHGVDACYVEPRLLREDKRVNKAKERQVNG